MINPTLLIFAKFPGPGQVMTRLCPPLTPEQAASVQRACIRLICERAFRSWPVRPVLIISPDDAETGFREFAGPYIPIRLQGQGDLGQRLERAVRAALDEGARQVLVIGADSPTMPHRLLTDAVDALNKSGAAIGPCDDGGFYLLALNQLKDGMFDGVDWGTDRAAEQLTERMKSCGVKVSQLEKWYDIDRPEDLERAAADLAQARESDTFELSRVLGQVLETAKSTSGASKRRKK